jgi:hypothetical protein
MNAIIGLVYLSIILFLFGMAVYGVYLAFSASILLGIICLFLSPAYSVFGFLMIFFGINLPALIVAAL